MALHIRACRTAVAGTARCSPVIVLSRSYAANTPYPFTKPNDPANAPSKKQIEAKADTPYPFTNLSEPRKVAMPAGKADPPGPMQDNSELVSAQAQQDLEGVAQPDYDVTLDNRTSVYSPIPLRVMDGSEPSEITPAAVLSGAPTELQARTVRIFKPVKPATQSGDWHSHIWQMDWDILGKGHRWENPLMGWQSSGDFMQATHLNFKSKEDAIRFAQKQGYEYFVQEPNERKFKPKAYAAQFEHNYSTKVKHVRTK